MKRIRIVFVTIIAVHWILIIFLLLWRSGTIESLFAIESPFFTEVESDQIVYGVDPELECFRGGSEFGEAVDVSTASRMYRLSNEEEDISKILGKLSKRFIERIGAFEGKVIHNGVAWNHRIISNNDIALPVNIIPIVTDGRFIVYQIGKAKGSLNLRVIRMINKQGIKERTYLFLDTFELH